ncbi:hypothetical protein AT959_05160 [Dechloromonas denitrificans]|uniref:Uncharacterized protein n=1 Tax=Dechloromonas denitrificans TaxID=281362 RepID=A0A133XLC8_9RHOO|nr:hypothetical protein [Dechloromonas denitrificans]KXB31744.1 hypothetical protein AT959_05160 [Dechloromonas denitrificans]
MFVISKYSRRARGHVVACDLLRAVLHSACDLAAERHNEAMYARLAEDFGGYLVTDSDPMTVAEILATDGGRHCAPGFGLFSDRRGLYAPAFDELCTTEGAVYGCAGLHSGGFVRQSIAVVVSWRCATANGRRAGWQMSPAGWCGDKMPCLCNDCLRVVMLTVDECIQQADDSGMIPCECGGDVCPCGYCDSILAGLVAGVRDGEALGLAVAGPVEWSPGKGFGK